MNEDPKPEGYEAPYLKRAVERFGAPRSGRTTRMIEHIAEHCRTGKPAVIMAVDKWHGWFVFLSKHRDSDCLTRANFDAGWAAIMHLEEVPIPDDCADPAQVGFPHRNEQRTTESVRIVQESNPLVGWHEWIAIHSSNTAALRIADEIAGRLEGYPVVNEELWTEYETEEADDVWRRRLQPLRARRLYPPASEPV